MLKKLIIFLLLVVVAAAAFVFYYAKTSADKDIEEITTAVKKKLSEAELDKMAEEQVDNISTALAAFEQAADLDISKRVKILANQVKNDSAAVRLAAVTKLAELKDEAGEDAQKIIDLLKKVAKDDEDEDVRMMAEIALEPPDDEADASGEAETKAEGSK